jgi:hypothetical protein
MALNINGVTIPETAGRIVIEGSEVEKVVHNGTVVWEVVRNNFCFPTDGAFISSSAARTYPNCCVIGINLGGWADIYISITKYDFQKLSSTGKKYLWMYREHGMDNGEAVTTTYTRNWGSILVGAVGTNIIFCNSDGSLNSNAWSYSGIKALTIGGQVDITTSGAGIIFPVDDKPSGWYAVEITDAVNYAIENSLSHITLQQTSSYSTHAAYWRKPGIMSVLSYAMLGITNITDFDVRTVHCISDQNTTPPTLSDYKREGKSGRAYKITNAIRDAYSSYFPQLNFDSLWV